MELQRRAQPEREQRCPYCHDHLALESEEALTCPACGTEHHAACVRELGRCTTLGCERALTLDGRGRPIDPAIRREIGRRYRAAQRRSLALGDALAAGLASAIAVGLPLFLLGFVLANGGRHLLWAAPLTLGAGCAGCLLGYRHSSYRRAGEGSTTTPSGDHEREG